MKRSEMILLIAERFRENGVRPTRRCMEEAEYLLDNIESSGMLPPKPKNALNDGWSVSDYEWESEDE